MVGRQAIVLIVSAPEDIHATTVAKHLAALGARPELVDLRRFPTEMSVSLAYGSSTDIVLQLAGGANINARDITSVWWRRPQRPEISPQIAELPHRQFAHNEVMLTLNGLWQTLECQWVNPIKADAAAGHKPYQLKIAPQVGLEIPDTLITNDPVKAAEFIESHRGKVVYKALAGLPDAWRETRLLRDEERSLLSAVQYAPVIFQELIEGNDLRITIIGEEIFAAEMDTSKSRYPYDIRMDMTVPARQVTLDAGTAEALLRLMKKLGIVYGAIDMRRRPDGSYVFFEINPAGQFLYIEELTGAPISKALASRLAMVSQETDYGKKTA